MGRGYSGNHPRYSGERYDAKQAYNKDLTASARLHYLENDRSDHDSPHHMSVNERLDDSFGLGQNTSTTPSPFNVEGGKAAHTKSTSQKAEFAWEGHKQGSHHKIKLGQITPKPSEEEIEAMSKENQSSPMNNRVDRLRDRAAKISSRTEGQGGYDYENNRVNRLLDKANTIDERSGMNSTDERSGELREREMNDMMDNRSDSPFNACAKDEGGSGCIKQTGGAWRVISNKTDKPWPAKYGSKSKAEAALRGYHAG